MPIPEDAIEVAHTLPTRKPTNSAQQGVPAQIPEAVVIARFRAGQEHKRLVHPRTS